MVNYNHQWQWMSKLKIYYRDIVQQHDTLLASMRFWVPFLVFPPQNYYTKDTLSLLPHKIFLLILNIFIHLFLAKCFYCNIFKFRHAPSFDHILHIMKNWDKNSIRTATKHLALRREKQGWLWREESTKGKGTVAENELSITLKLKLKHSITWTQRRKQNLFG